MVEFEHIEVRAAAAVGDTASRVDHQAIVRRGDPAQTGARRTQPGKIRLGVHVENIGIWSSGSRDASIFDPNADFDGDFLASQFPGSLGSGGTGFIGGGQAGYNWQTGAFVIGVETDFDGSTVGRDFHFSSAPFAGPFFTGAGVETDIEPGPGAFAAQCGKTATDLNEIRLIGDNLVSRIGDDAV